jgi:alpha-amylase
MGGGSESQFAATYPSADNFHHPICQIQDYCDHQQVRFCQLSGLNDLATDTEPVRAKIAAYLNDLLSLGVTGFRFDASKHMWPADLQSIVGRLNKNHYNQAPPLFQEVIRGPACEITPDEYFNTSPTARVTEFLYATNVAGKVSSNAIADLVTFPIGQSWGMVPDNKAVVFIDNHDTERHAAPLTYKSGPKYYLATAFMLAWPYGFPKVLSGFLFTDIDAGSPSTSSGDIAATDCNDPNGNLWTCTHRFRPVAAASQFRAVTSGSNTVSNIYTISGNANVVGFSRSGKGYIFFNGGSTATTVTVQTGLPAGFYCDVASGDLTPTGCSGSMVEVSSTGSATFTANGSNIVVIHIKSKTDQSCVTNKTCNSCSVFGYRQDCGYAGVTQSDCLAKNCCWIPSNIPNQPWCFSHNYLQSTANLRGYAAELM